MKLLLIIIMSLLPLNSLTQDNYECDGLINTEAEAISCAMWHSRVISGLSINGYKFIATETESGWIIEHANQDLNGSTYSVSIKRNGELIELNSK